MLTSARPSSPPAHTLAAGGKISLTQLAETQGVNILYNPEANPERFHSFSSYTNSINRLGAGHFCTDAPDFAAEGIAEGTDVTLLVIYQLAGRDTYYYQCADITLGPASSFVEPSVCGNHTGILEVAGEGESYTSGGSTETAGFGGQTGGASGTNPHTSGSIDLEGNDTTDANGQATGQAASSTSTSSRLSAAAGGGIGAGVAVVVLLGALAAAYFTGFVSFGKKSKRNTNATRDDISEASSAPPMKAVA